MANITIELAYPEVVNIDSTLIGLWVNYIYHLVLR